LKGQTILQGFRDHTTGLWTVPLGATPQAAQLPPTMPHALPEPQPLFFQAANSTYHMKNKRELTMFYHATAGYPVPSTWIQVIQAGNYATWPASQPT
jgi:hypothetical protein